MRWQVFHNFKIHFDYIFLPRKIICCSISSLLLFWCRQTLLISHVAMFWFLGSHFWIKHDVWWPTGSTFLTRLDFPKETFQWEKRGWWSSDSCQLSIQSSFLIPYVNVREKLEDITLPQRTGKRWRPAVAQWTLLPSSRDQKNGECYYV